MFPKIPLAFLGENYYIYTFGVFMVASSFLFLWMWRKIVRKEGMHFQPIKQQLPLVILITLLCSRLVNILFYWGIPGKASFDPSHPIASFFFMSDFYLTLGDFYLSLIGAMIGAGISIWFLILRKEKDNKKMKDIIDGCIVAFLFAMIFGYFGAFLGGQIYGELSDSAISLNYAQYNPKIGEEPRVPLAIIYSFVTGVLFSFFYILRHSHRITPGNLGIMALVGWSFMIFLGEFYSDSSRDILSARISILNLNQISLLVFMILGIYLFRRWNPNGNQK